MVRAANSTRQCWSNDSVNEVRRALISGSSTSATKCQPQRLVPLYSIVIGCYRTTRNETSDAIVCGDESPKYFRGLDKSVFLVSSVSRTLSFGTGPASLVFQQIGIQQSLTCSGGSYCRLLLSYTRIIISLETNQ